MEIFVGTFTKEEIKNKKDREAIDKMAKKTGFKYVRGLLTQEKGEKVMKVWVSDMF